MGEADRLITILTKDNGLITAYASGVKNIKSKRGSSTGLLCYSDFSLSVKGTTYRVAEATPIKLFFGTNSDVEILGISQYFCELALTFGNSARSTEEFLRLILNSLHFLNQQKKNPYLIKSITELRVMATSGYCPNLIACDNCGKFIDDIMSFDIANGTLLCSECDNGVGRIKINQTIINALRHIVYSPFERLYLFTIPDEDIENLQTVTENYIEYQTDKKFTTLDFLRNIKRGTY